MTCSIHPEPSPFAGKQVRVTKGQHAGRLVMIEDWQSRVYNGLPWMFAQHNPSAMIYGIRAGAEGLPLDNEVLYGEGTMFHVSEVELVEC